MRRLLLSVLMIMCLISLVSCREVEVPVSNQSDYLILMYLAGDNNVAKTAIRQVRQVEAALTSIRNADGTAMKGFCSVNVLALLDGPSDCSDDVGIAVDSQTRLLLVGPDDNSQLSEIDYTLSYQTKDISDTFPLLADNPRRELNMADSDTLQAFLEYARRNYSADKMILYFFDHGLGPVYNDGEEHFIYGSKGLCVDDDPNVSCDYCLTTGGIISALRNSGYTGDERPVAIIEDMCLQASIDEAYALALNGSADYFMASENVTYGESVGLGHLISNMRKYSDIENLLKDEVIHYRDLWQELFKAYELNMTMSVVDLRDSEPFESLASSMDSLAQIVIDNEEVLSEMEIDPSLKTRNLLFNGTFTRLRDIADLMDYIVDIYDENNDETVVYDIVTDIRNSLRSIIIRSYSDTKGLHDGYEYGLTAVTMLEKYAKYQTSDPEIANDYSNWTLFSKNCISWSELVNKVSEANDKAEN